MDSKRPPLHILKQVARESASANNIGDTKGTDWDSDLGQNFTRPEDVEGLVHSDNVVRPRNDSDTYWGESTDPKDHLPREDDKAVGRAALSAFHEEQELAQTQQRHPSQHIPNNQ